MLRMSMCAMAVLALTVGTSYAAKAKPVAGTIKSIDAATGMLTVAVKVKKETTDKQFKITDTTKITIVDGADKKELTGKVGLKNDQVKSGAKVSITTDADGNVTQLTVGMAKKKKKT